MNTPSNFLYSTYIQKQKSDEKLTVLLFSTNILNKNKLDCPSCNRINSDNNLIYFSQETVD